jgi:hypothetical protein
VKGNAKTIKTTVPIITNGNGEPEIPSITKDDGYYGKVVQKALREYCAAHLREFYPYSIPHCLTYLH